MENSRQVPDINRFLETAYNKLSDEQRREYEKRAQGVTSKEVPFTRRLTGERVHPSEVLARKIVDEAWKRLMKGEQVDITDTVSAIASKPVRRNVKEAAVEERFMYDFKEAFRRALIKRDFRKVDKLYEDIGPHSTGPLRTIKGARWIDIHNRVNNFGIAALGEMVGRKDDLDIQTMLITDSWWVGRVLLGAPVWERKDSPISQKIMRGWDPDERLERDNIVRQAIKDAVCRCILRDVYHKKSGYGFAFHSIYQRAVNLGILPPEDVFGILSDPSISKAITQDIKTKIWYYINENNIKRLAAAELLLEEKLNAYVQNGILSRQGLQKLFSSVVKELEQEHSARVPYIITSPITQKGKQRPIQLRKA